MGADEVFVCGWLTLVAVAFIDYVREDMGLRRKPPRPEHPRLKGLRFMNGK